MSNRQGDSSDETGMFPTDDEIIAAMDRAKKELKVRSHDMMTDEKASAQVRLLLPLPRQNCSLSALRGRMFSLSKAKREPGPNKTTPRQIADRAIKKLGEAYERNGEHSAEYDEIHASDEFKEIKNRLKRETDSCCQLCNRHLPLELEGHIIDYKRWNHPGMMLLLCRSACHPVADNLRRWGMEREDEANPEMTLFDVNPS